MATETQLRAWLTEAESAFHALATGKRAVKLAYDGESLEYTAADRQALSAHIERLRSLLNETGPSLAPRRGRARPVLF